MMEYEGDFSLIEEKQEYVCFNLPKMLIIIFMNKIKFRNFRRFSFGKNTVRLCLIAIMSAVFTSALLAGRQITGTVTDTTGDPLIGVSVLQKETTNGTVTDLDGNFQLSVPQGSILSFFLYRLYYKRGFDRKPVAVIYILERILKTLMKW